MCRTGKINGVNYQDSLFRGIEVDGGSVDSDKIQFERALVNSQISNILKQAGVDTSSITKDCTFTVDPYSYEITVNGVDEETMMLSRLVDTFFSRTSWTMLLYGENHSISVA